MKIFIRLSLIYAIWAATFVYKSSFLGIDNFRYYCLFDDAMISMRYAFNFSSGNGLVWNIGERVEGITNTFWALIMSIGTLLFDKSAAVLFIQVLGILIIILIANNCILIMSKLRSIECDKYTSIKTILLVLLIYSYYPLSYWTLMGMETGCLTLIITTLLVSVFRGPDGGKYLNPILSAIAFLTRPDALIFIIIIYIYQYFIYKENYNYIKKIKFQFVLFIILFIIILIIRYYYYGDYLQNTYKLKINGMPILDRISNGAGFIYPFLISILPFLIVIHACYKKLFNSKIILLLSMIYICIIYQVWVGGDPWSYWRMLCPVIPLIFILTIDSIFSRIKQFSSDANLVNNPIKYIQYRYPFLFCVLFVFYIIANFKFLNEQYFLTSAYQVRSNEYYVNTAIALNELLEENSVIAVFAAGSVPYYTVFKAMDMLGKSDRYIAGLAPDLSGAIAWERMTSVPGHNKYDLNYSIIQLKPDYVQGCIFGKDDITNYCLKRYSRAHYKGIGLWLLAGSSSIRWGNLVDFETLGSANE